MVFVLPILLHTDAIGLCIPDGHIGLVQPQNPFLEAVKQYG